MTISGHTTVAGVIGSPVRYSLSPLIHNAAYAACGLDWVYVALEVPPGSVPAALDGMRSFGIAGLSVTTPHKDDVFAAVDSHSVAAGATRAVNCVQLATDGRLIGHNTDGDGLVDWLIESDADPSGRSVVVLGAGGAARSVVEALGRRGAAEVVVVNRTVDRATVAAALAGAAGRVGTEADVADADIVVNATSVGLGSTELPLRSSNLRSGHVVVDLVYHPPETALLEAAAAAGARPVDGLGMLVHQAGHQFRIWTGLEPPIDEMRRVAQEHVRRAG